MKNVSIMTVLTSIFPLHKFYSKILGQLILLKISNYEVSLAI